MMADADSQAEVPLPFPELSVDMPLLPTRSQRPAVRQN